MNKGFSLIELLTVIVIIAVLLIIGVRSYSNQKNKVYVAWAKAEMIEVSKLMKTAKAYDGFYHQYIYAMGYRPKGDILAVVGTAASASDICCDEEYPDPGVSPCEKNGRSGFLYYNCKDTSLDKATDNVDICGPDPLSPTLYDSCKNKFSLNSLPTAGFTACPLPPEGWCDCDQFTIGAKTNFDKKLTITERGTMCED